MLKTKNSQRRIKINAKYFEIKKSGSLSMKISTELKLKVLQFKLSNFFFYSSLLLYFCSRFISILRSLNQSIVKKFNLK